MGKGKGEGDLYRGFLPRGHSMEKYQRHLRLILMLFAQWHL